MEANLGVSMAIQPPNAEEIQSIIEVRLASRTKGLEESISVDWRDGRLAMPVVSMPIDMTFYNPNTRRIQAQRAVDPTREEELLRDPFSAKSQNYLDDLLKWDPARPGRVDPAFDKLKDDLAKHGQDEPGLMTRAGLLINGNTRRAALKALGKENIRVGVLPTDTSRADLDALELTLQLRKTYKRDYSFVNELLAIRAEVDKGVPESQILKAFRMKRQRLERSIWLLEFINDAIRRSAVLLDDGTSASLHQYDFERDQGQLEELYRAWHKQNKTDPDKAQLLREARLAAVALDFAKTDLRVMDPSFFEKYVRPSVVESDLPLVPTEETRGIPGLPDVVLPEVPQTLRELKSYTTSILQARAIAGASSAERPIPEFASGRLERARRVFDDARKRAGATAELRRRRSGPADKVLEAGDALDEAAAALADAQAADSLDVDALEDALESLQQALARLSQLLSRIPDDDKDQGFAWVEAAVNLVPDGEG